MATAKCQRSRHIELTGQSAVRVKSSGGLQEKKTKGAPGLLCVTGFVRRNFLSCRFAIIG
jgi:hypothetical protein